MNALLHYVRDLSGIGGELRPGIVHRLDRHTSGVLLVAKTDRAHRAFAPDAEAAAAQGVPGPRPPGFPRVRKGEVVLAIGRDPRDRKKMKAFRPNSRRSAGRRPGGAHALRDRAGVADPRPDAPPLPPRHRPHAPDPRASRGRESPHRGRPGLRPRALPEGRRRAARSSSSSFRARRSTPSGSSSTIPPRRSCRDRRADPGGPRRSCRRAERGAIGSPR